MCWNPLDGESCSRRCNGATGHPHPWCSEILCGWQANGCAGDAAYFVTFDFNPDPVPMCPPCLADFIEDHRDDFISADPYSGIACAGAIASALFGWLGLGDVCGNCGARSGEMFGSAHDVEPLSCAVCGAINELRAYRCSTFTMGAKP
jgi:hypothetical protein